MGPNQSHGSPYKKKEGDSLEFQLFGLQAFTDKSPSPIPVLETKTQKRSSTAGEGRGGGREEIRTHKTLRILGHKETRGHDNAFVCTSRKENSRDTTLSTPDPRLLASRNGRKQFPVV